MNECASSKVQKREWFAEEPVDGADRSKPKLFEWCVDGVCIYIGQYTEAERLRRDYELNLLRIWDGRPYRKQKPAAFRQIHHDLAKAILDGRKITLRIQENEPVKDERNRRKRELISARITSRNS